MEKLIPAKPGAQGFSALSLCYPGPRHSPGCRKAASGHAVSALRRHPQNQKTPKAKGARHCCQAPCRRTAAVDPDGSSAWFRRLLGPRRQGHANLGSVVEAGRSPLIPKESCGYQPRRPASSSRPGAGNRKPCWTLLSPSDPFRTRRSACASHRAFRSLRRAVPSFPEVRTLARRFRKPGYRPLSVSSFCLEPCSRTAFRLSPGAALARRLSAVVSPVACAPRSTPASHRTCVQHSASGRAVPWRSSKLPQRVGGASVSQLPGLSHPRTEPECGFPKAPAPFPARVSP